MENLPIGVIITVTVIVLVALFLIFREVWCWYWKINKRVRLLEAIGDKFESLDKSIKLFMERQPLPMAGSAEKLSAEKETENKDAYEQWDTGKLLGSLKSSDYDAATKEQFRKALLSRYGIRYEEGKYRYRDYVSDDIVGAVECAQLYNK